MFWDRVAGVYDLFANFYNAGTHRVLCQEVASLVSSEDEVLKCACGTGLLTRHIAPACKHIVATDYSGKMLDTSLSKMFIIPDLLLLVYVDDAAQAVNPFLEAVHANHSKDISQSVGNDGYADKGREYTCGDIQVLKA